MLARIAGLFSRRGFNIDSLAVGPTEHAEVSRMTIVVNVEDSPLEQVTKQLNKLVEVIKIVELDGSASVNRELLLVKVKADAETRGQVLDVVQLFRAKVVDVAPDAVDDPGDRQRRQARRPAAGCSSPSASASSSSPAWSPSAAAPARSPSAPCARSPYPSRPPPAAAAERPRNTPHHEGAAHRG